MITPATNAYLATLAGSYPTDDSPLSYNQEPTHAQEDTNRLTTTPGLVETLEAGYSSPCARVDELHVQVKGLGGLPS